MEYTPEVIAALRAKVSIEGVRRAREALADRLPRTPLIRHPVLCGELGFEYHLKHENHLPTGAFKVRGGFNYMASLSPEKASRGVISATRGNHGQSLATAAAAHGVRCTIVVPHGNNPEKNAAMRAQGAELIEHGRDFDEAREFSVRLMETEGLTFVHAGNEPNLIHGVGTYALEIYEDLPQVDVVIVPLGGGSGVCGALTVFRALKPDTRIVAVQAENAPSIYNSWKRGERTETDTAETFADGLATRCPFELTFDIIKDEIDDIVLVSEEEMRSAIVRLLRTTHNLAEGAGAAATAAAFKMRGELAGKTVAGILSGGNLDAATLKWALEGEPAGALSGAGV